jgi:hypothetical protein
MARGLTRNRSDVSALLAVVMAVVGCGVSLSHAHAAGSAPHSHALGWSAVDHTGPRVPLDTHNTTGEPHRHLILFGVELPGESMPVGLPCCGGDLHIGTALGSVCTPAADADLPAADPAPVTVPVAEPVAPLTCTHPRPAPAVRLSAVALRTLSGVLRS